MSGTGFNYMTDALGEGTITITGTRKLDVSAYMSTNTQPIVITAHDSGVAAIQNSGSTVFLGAVASDGDFIIDNQWDTPRFLSGIFAPGHTITYKVPSWNNGWWYAESELKDVDASLIVEIANGRPLVVSAASGTSSNGLSVAQGTVKFLENSAWGSISLASGAMVNVASGVTIDCDTLAVAGVVKDKGVYRAVKLPEAISGAGRIRVGGEAPLVIIVR